MIYTSYCDVEPIKSQLDAARGTMSIEDQVDMEDALQRWGYMGPENAHIYATTTVRLDVLARKVRFVNRYLVGVHDHDKNMIIAVSMDAGSINRVVNPAFLLIGFQTPPPIRNPNWTG